MKKKRNPVSVHLPFSGYVHQIELVGESRMLILSGQVGADSSGEIADGVSQQLALAWKNVSENLSAADMSQDDIVKLTVYLKDGSINTNDRRSLLSETFETIAPCMTVLYVAAFGDPRMEVELDVWAATE